MVVLPLAADVVEALEVVVALPDDVLVVAAVVDVLEAEDVVVDVRLLLAVVLLLADPGRHCE